jgi:hypothetical protein
VKAFVLTHRISSLYTRWKQNQLAVISQFSGRQTALPVSAGIFIASHDFCCRGQIAISLVSPTPQPLALAVLSRAIERGDTVARSTVCSRSCGVWIPLAINPILIVCLSRASFSPWRKMRGFCSYYATAASFQIPYSSSFIYCCNIRRDILANDGVGEYPTRTIQLAAPMSYPANRIIPSCALHALIWYSFLLEAE